MRNRKDFNNIVHLFDQKFPTNWCYYQDWENDYKKTIYKSPKICTENVINYLSFNSVENLISYSIELKNCNEKLCTVLLKNHESFIIDNLNKWNESDIFTYYDKPNKINHILRNLVSIKECFSATLVDLLKPIFINILDILKKEKDKMWIFRRGYNEDKNKTQFYIESLLV